MRYFVLALLLSLFLACEKDPVSIPIGNGQTKKIAYTFSLAPLSNGNNSPIQLNYAYIMLSDYFGNVINDTIKLYGPPPQTFNRSYELESDKHWELYVRVVDINDSVVYRKWDESLYIQANTTTTQTIELLPQYSFLNVVISPLPYPLDSCELIVDNKIICDTSFDLSYWDSLRFFYPYLSASEYGETHSITINLYGDYFGTYQKLYTHTGPIVVYPCIDWVYNTDLEWVGPSAANGTAFLKMKMGNFGTVTVRGTPTRKFKSTILWNTLSSTYSYIGPSAEKHGSPMFIDAVFGKGLKTPTGNDGLIFRNVLPVDEGTIQFWWIPDTSEPDNHPMLIGNANLSEFGIGKNVNPGYKGFTFQFGTNYMQITYPYEMKAGDRIFIGCTWKRNLDSIDLGMHVVINDTLYLKDHSQQIGYVQDQTDRDIRVGSVKGYLSPIKSYGVIDNLKIFNWVKEDFSDRSVE